MILTSLNAINYKNISDARLSFSDNVNCFVGRNGMGKTNVLDAVYYLSFCKSSTGTLDAVTMRHGEDFFMLHGLYVNDAAGSDEVTIGARRGQRKRLKVNGKDVARLADHVGRIPLVMISPAGSQLISGASDERRRFMNSVVSQYSPGYLAAAMRYERSLKQRNALLRGDDEPEASVMDVLEEMMALDAETLYAERRVFVEEFLPVFSSIYAQLCSVNDEEAGISYVSHAERGSLLPLLRADRHKERIVGYTLHGPHRDELQLTLRGYDVRREGSQGQRKTFYIALKLAQYVYLRSKGERRTPILLLDDIFDKLDSHRVACIVDYVSGNAFGQIFITDTNRTHIDRILEATQRDYRLFSVADGDVTPQT